MSRLPPFVALAAIVALLSLSVARADGEAGVIIQDGDSVRTFCVAFKGDSVRGDQLLTSAGLAFGQFGGSARTVCSIGGTGCADASSFDSCFCKCQSGGGDCTYWAFFTQRYGSPWTYSTIGFNLSSARDGDLQGWRWGKGSLQSAPPPASVSFEQVCGHAPRGGLQATATPPAPTAVITAALSPTGGAAGAPTTSAPQPPSSSTPSDASTPTRSIASSDGPSPSSIGPTALVTIGSPVAQADQLDESEGDNEEDAATPIAIVAFAVLAGLMGLAILYALVRRRRGGI